MDGKSVYLSASKTVNLPHPIKTICMYETEINSTVEAGSEIPPEIRKTLAEADGKVLYRTVLPWSEHCTECVWPTCYSTCDLYTPRQDGRCRRFVDGMVRVDAATPFQPYLVKITFKRWAKLWAPGTIRMHPAKRALTLDRRDRSVGSALVRLPLPPRIRTAVVSKRYSYKKKSVRVADTDSNLPTNFMLECYNPESQNVRLSITMRSASLQKKIPFQHLIDLTPGFHRIRIPAAEISSLLDVRAPFGIDIMPDGENADETTLYFGLIDFVQEEVPVEPETEADAKKIKCVVWDLDNTLWNGILVEDGLANLVLKTGIAEIIQTLDKRGILQSIASKNSPDEALRALKHFRLDEYFVCPQISWRPKSESIDEIALQLNIGSDTLLFIDDAIFEREEVGHRCPGVRTLDARDYHTLLDMNGLNVPITDESSSRRKLYQRETERKKIAEEFGDDYLSFLKHCEIEISMVPLAKENLNRVHELAQRTNQMNFSGNRYDYQTLEKILHTQGLDTYVISCRDRFGSYGIIGFGIVDNREPRMTDLMFSCRVQTKRVEHAFLAYILEKYIGETGKDFYATYRKTSRNAPSGKVFADLGMEEIDIQDGVSNLIFRKDRCISNDQVIHMLDHHRPAVPTR
jgi:FkbH-like protein